MIKNCSFPLFKEGGRRPGDFFKIFSRFRQVGIASSFKKEQNFFIFFFLLAWWLSFIRIRKLILHGCLFMLVPKIHHQDYLFMFVSLIHQLFRLLELFRDQ